MGKKASCMADDRTTYNNFELLVGRHRGLIRRLCWWRSSGDESLCDDLVQECYLAMWEHYGTLRPDVTKLQEAAWVVWQCRSIFSHHDREPGNAGTHIRIDRMMFNIADDDVRAPRDVAETLDELATLLTPDEQRLFALMRQDLTDLEIAERLGLKTRTIREHQRAIIEKLRQHTYNQTFKHSNNQ